MATTTNYGWTTPDDTALVKDGAAAIRTLGSSVDTTTKNLNPETTLGDIAYRSSTANVKTRLGLGTAGQILQVNSGATAPEWTTLVTGGMTLLQSLSLTGASVTSSTLSSAYKQFLVLTKGVYGAAYAGIALRLNADTGSNYAYQLIDGEGSTGVGVSGSSSATSFFNYGLMNSSSATKTLGNGMLYIMRPTDTDSVFINSNFYGYDGSSTRLKVQSGVYDCSAAITSITLFTTSTFTAGTAEIYGVN
jgi:hypothetical protein